MGWRPWNCFRNHFTQQTARMAIDALAVRNRTVKGEPGLVSLCDLGYCRMGIDEGYEKMYPNNHSFHDWFSGLPLVDKTTFHDMQGLVAHAHAQPNMKIEWYLNSCWMGGPQFNTTFNYEGDVRALQNYGFDGVKIDGCGKMNNMTKYAEIMMDHGLNITIENCHGDCPGRGLPCTDQGQGGLRPAPGYCPWTSYHTSNDIQAFSESWFDNLQVHTCLVVLIFS
eukprot:COSAG02_NODE_114_length_35585_cov_149.458293_14_plen_224_part_00